MLNQSRRLLFLLYNNIKKSGEIFLMLKEFYNGKKVLITGHTGFKGSWLSLWLKSLGSDVLGYSFTDSKFFS